MLFKFPFVLIILILFQYNVVLVDGQEYPNKDIRHIFTASLIKHLGDGSNVTVAEIEGFYSNNNLSLDNIPRKPVTDCLANVSSRSPENQEKCLTDTCLAPNDVYKLSGLSRDTSDREVSTMSMILLNLLESKTCRQEEHEKTDHKQDGPPSAVETWGYGILCTTIIVLVALGGFLVLPFVHGKNYKRALIFMVGLAVGTLAGSSLIFLLPEALELTDQNMDEHSSLWKCLAMINAIYFFFVIERVLKIIIGWRQRKKRKPVQEANNGVCFISLPLEAKNKDPNCTDLDTPPHVSSCTDNMSRDSGIDNVSEATDKDIANNTVTDRKKRKPVQEANNGVCLISLSLKAKNKDPNCTDLDTSPHVSSCTNNMSLDSGIDNVSETTDKDVANTTGIDVTQNVTDILNTDKEAKHIAPVAWMIIFGDALHNFIDGVSIGAAFTKSVLVGVSVSVAVFCEELPHELGDFAVLLSAGMSKKKAVISNFLSACTIYIGLVVGIFLGENVSAHTWVFAIAGGMFLYIALVDMMPELCAFGEREENRKLIGTGAIFLLQNLGIISGFVIIMLLAIYGGTLEHAITKGS